MRTSTSQKNAEQAKNLHVNGSGCTCCGQEDGVGRLFRPQHLGFMWSVQQARSDAPADAAAGSNGSGGGGGGFLSSVMTRLGFMSEEEKRKLSFDKQMDLLKEGGLFVRHLPGKPPTPVWLELALIDDGTAARIEWRSPQLVLNRAVNKDGIPLDACQHFRASTASDDPGAKADLCFTIVAERTCAVFEAPSVEVRDAWIAAGGNAIKSLVPQMDAQLQKKLADERRQKQIQERKDSRDARRAEYSKAGM